jgi:hypothetical protein
MPNTPTRLILFLSSYAPLFVIIALRAWRDSRHLAVGIAIVAILSVIVLFVFLRTARKLSAEKVGISSISSRDGDAMSYIVTYLLPFLAVTLSDPTDVVSLCIVLFVIGLLYVNSNMIYTNPVLNVVGYHIFQVQDSDGKTSALISKRSYIRIGSEVDVISLGDYVLLEKA